MYLVFYVCRFIYTGSVEVTTDIAQELLRAADQYLLEGLKRLCEYAIAQVTEEFVTYDYFEIFLCGLTKFSIFMQFSRKSLFTITDIYPCKT